MKQRSIKKTIRLAVTLSLALVLFSAILFSLYLWNERMTTSKNQQISNCITMVNNMISALNAMHSTWAQNAQDAERTLSDPAFALSREKFEDNALSFVQSTSRLSLSLLSSDRLLSFVGRLLGGEDLPPMISELGDAARALSSMQRKSIEGLSNSTRTLFYVVLFLSLLLFLLYFLFFRSFQRFSDKVVHAFSHLDNVLNRRDDRFHFQPDWKEEALLGEQVQKVEEQLVFAQNLSQVPSLGILEDVIPELFSALETQLPVDRLGVAFLDNQNNVIAETAFSKMRQIFLGPGFQTNLEKTSLVSLRCEDKPRIIPDLEKHLQENPTSKSTQLILQEGLRSSITMPICFGKKVLGFVFVSSAKKQAFSMRDATVIAQFTTTLKNTIFHSFVTQEVISATSKAFADLVEKKDFETGFHLQRVAHYSKFLAEELAKDDPAISPKFIREMFWFSPLHDIGKVGIPDQILLKPGRLTPEEFDVMKTHVSMGESVLDQMNQNLLSLTTTHFLDTAVAIIAGHHEKFDGSGYPRGLKGQNIPLAGRIVAIADVFDALTTERPYKPPFSFERSVSIIREGVGKHFDPKIAGIFLENLDTVKHILTDYGDK